MNKIIIIIIERKNPNSARCWSLPLRLSINQPYEHQKRNPHATNDQWITKHTIQPDEHPIPIPTRTPISNHGSILSYPSTFPVMTKKIQKQLGNSQGSCRPHQVPTWPWLSQSTKVLIPCHKGRRIITGRSVSVSILAIYLPTTLLSTACLLE